MYSLNQTQIIVINMENLELFIEEENPEFVIGIYGENKELVAL